MSFLTSSTARSMRCVRPQISLPQQRFFTPATRCLVRHQDPEQTEKLKQEQLKKQEQGKGEWHEDLASSSESHVKADRENVKDHDDHIEKLQKETAQQAEKEKQ